MSWTEEPQTARAVAAKLATEAQGAKQTDRAIVWALLAIADALRASMPHRDATLPTYNPDGSPA